MRIETLAVVARIVAIGIRSLAQMRAVSRETVFFSTVPQ
jgi:hypothetical protein